MFASWWRVVEYKPLGGVEFTYAWHLRCLLVRAWALQDVDTVGGKARHPIGLEGSADLQIGKRCSTSFTDRALCLIRRRPSQVPCVQMHEMNLTDVVV
jgi:hypothetical protein